jgi:hypothetical protein
MGAGGSKRGGGGSRCVLVSGNRVLVGRKGCLTLEKGGGGSKRGPSGSKWGAGVENGCEWV